MPYPRMNGPARRPRRVFPGCQLALSLLLTAPLVVAAAAIEAPDDSSSASSDPAIAAPSPGASPEITENVESAAEANAQGLRAKAAGDIDQAARHFRRAIHLSSLKPDSSTSTHSPQATAQQRADTLRYRANLGRALLETGDLPALQEELKTLDQTLSAPGIDAVTVAEIRVAMADLYRQSVNELYADTKHRLSAFEQLEKAAQVAPAEDDWLGSFINGYRAHLYLDEQRPSEALVFARRAVEQAQRLQSANPLYRWEWLSARALSMIGQESAALATYERASESLQKARGQLDADPDALEHTVRPLLLEYADLSLRLAAKVGQEEQQTILRNTRNALEAIKVAEVEDYFQAPCVTTHPSELDLLESGSAVIYPVILADRVELIVSIGDQLTRATSPVNRNELTALVRDFRLNLQVDTATRDFIRQGQQLHDWLIGPIEAQLQANQVDTLVIVPDGALRTIPLAALHNGQQFLVERYALATVPGLTLYDPRPLSTESGTVLAGGLSESVQGFSALPSVDAELNVIESLLPAQTLRNQAFTKSAIQRELEVGDYSIVHLATHGQFRSSYAESFLLTHDQKMQLDELGETLQQRNNRHGALDLLVLSACESAAGDDRAALGLAGVAIRSGARSAVASLWEVDDQATQQLITAFYENLAREGAPSKAKSLQSAQQQLIARSETRHPSQWAPFLLIGDWL